MYRVPEGVVCLSPSWGFQRRQKCRDSRAMPPELWQHWSPLPRGLWSSGFLFSPWDSGWWFPCNAVVYRLYTLFMCLVLDTVALVYLQQGLLWAALFFRGAGAATSSHDSSLNRDQGPGKKGAWGPSQEPGVGFSTGGMGGHILAYTTWCIRTTTRILGVRAPASCFVSFPPKSDWYTSCCGWP